MSAAGSASRETVVVTKPALPAPRDACEQRARVRFGPGVPLVTEPPAEPAAPAAPDAPSRRRRAAIVAAGFTAGVIAFVAWVLWPAGPLHARLASVQANPQVVSCPGAGGHADVVATVTTNGSPGTLRYQWERSDGTSSGVLRQALAEGQKKASLHLRWTFSGRGTYAATATFRLLTPDPATALTRFSYHCG